MYSHDLEDYLNYGVKVAVMAGKQILEIRRNSQIDFTFKKFGELVTNADFASDRIIQKSFYERFPQHRIHSEEDNNENIETFKGPLWVIDPLDGTVNFAKGLPHFAVSIAFAVDGVVLLGIVHAPALELTFTGIKGKGSYCNGKSLQASKTTILKQSVIGTGLPHDKNQVGSALNRISRLVTNCKDIRRFASPTIDICYVAAGLLDGHTETLFPWDVAASGLIAREAGAKQGHIGEVPANIPSDLLGKDIIFSSPGIFEDLLTLLQSPEESR